MYVLSSFIVVEDITTKVSITEAHSPHVVVSNVPPLLISEWFTYWQTKELCQTGFVTSSLSFWVFTNSAVSSSTVMLTRLPPITIGVVMWWGAGASAYEMTPRKFLPLFILFIPFISDDHFSRISKASLTCNNFTFKALTSCDSGWASSPLRSRNDVRSFSFCREPVSSCQASLLISGTEGVVVWELKISANSSCLAVLWTGLLCSARLRLIWLLLSVCEDD